MTKQEKETIRQETVKALRSLKIREGGREIDELFKDISYVNKLGYWSALSDLCEIFKIDW